MHTEKYIRKRKLIAFGNSVLFILFRIFPINKNRIIVRTFEGKGGFGCNPKYIIKELHKKHKDLEIIWIVNDMSKKFPDYVKKVSNTPLKRAYWMTTSKVWIDNYRTTYGTKKRRGQYYLNTNHYTIGIKTVGLWRGEGFSRMAYIVSRADSSMIDALVIDSDFCLEMCPRGLLYKGTYLNIGAPRLDGIYNNKNRLRKKFRKKHNLSKNAKIVMYAPTFREKNKNGKRTVFLNKSSIDYEVLLEALKKSFGGEWYICIRVHPQLSNNYIGEKYINGKIIDESNADDMYEILPAMDVYITDYSSACFEAGYGGIPVFIYADDIEEYKKSRGELFWNFASYNTNKVCLNKKIFKKTKACFPFSVSTNNFELYKNILDFNEENYLKGLREFKSDLKVRFDGESSRLAAEWIEEKLAR